jgi:hypothetical protein
MIPVPRNDENDNLSESPRSADFMDEELSRGQPLTLKGDIPSKQAIRGYEQTNVIKKGILNNN